MQKDYPTFAKIHSRCRVGSLLALFHFCLVSVPFSGPSLTEMNFYMKLFSLSSVLIRGFLNQHLNRIWTCLLCCRWTLLTWEMNTFGAGDKRVENSHSNFSPTPLPTHTASYQQLSKATFIEMIATHRYSSSKTGSCYMYHTLVLAPKYATPTSYICNSILCWTKQHSSRISCKENNKQTPPYTSLAVSTASAQ